MDEAASPTEQFAELRREWEWAIVKHVQRGLGDLNMEVDIDCSDRAAVMHEYGRATKAVVSVFPARVRLRPTLDWCSATSWRSTGRLGPLSRTSAT